MRGISFKICNFEYKPISKILENVNIINFNWSISEDEIYLRGNNLSLFDTKYTSGKKFNNLINEKEYQAISANMRASFNAGYVEEFDNYEEFNKSDCVINIFCTDVNFYEVYVKDKLTLETIKTNCYNYGFNNIEYITKSNDGRTRFTITWQIQLKILIE